MEELIEKIFTKVITSGLKIIFVIVILLVGFKLIKWIVKLLKKGKAFSKLEKSVQSFFSSFLSITLKIVLILTVANYLGVPMTSLVTVIGSAGLALGLALQGGLSNIAGGVMIMVFKPFKVGDYIDTHSDNGTVSDISMFYTTLITVDNKKIVLPNGGLANANIINYSACSKRRVDLEFTVSYNSSVEKVKTLIEKEAKKCSMLIADEPIFVRMTKMGDSSLVFTLRVWVKKEDYWQTYFDLTENVKASFDKNNIEIPYPQLDVHLDK